MNGDESITFLDGANSNVWGRRLQTKCEKQKSKKPLSTLEEEIIDEKKARGRESRNKASRRCRLKKKQELYDLKSFTKLIAGRDDPEKAMEMVKEFKERLYFDELALGDQDTFLIQMKKLFGSLREKNRKLEQENGNLLHNL